MAASLSIPTDEEREQQLMRRREQISWGVLAVMLLAAAGMRERDLLLGIALGGALGWANYRWLASSLRVLLRTVEASGKASRRALLFFVLRLIVIWGAIGLVFWSRAVPIGAFVAGFCALVWALMLEVAYRIVLIISGREG